MTVPRLLILALTASAFAQNQPEVAVGTVEGTSANLIYVNSGTQLLVLSADQHTDVWKGKSFHNFSPVEVGDDIVARYRTGASGQLIAEAVWLNIVNSFGVITKVTRDGFELFTNPNADPDSAYKKETRVVDIDADTIFESSAKKDLTAGREVQIVGLDLRNGRIWATRVTVYDKR